MTTLDTTVSASTTEPHQPAVPNVPYTWAPRRWPRFLSISPTPQPPVELTDRPGRFLARILRGSWMPLAVGALLNAGTYLTAGLVPAILGVIIDRQLPYGLGAHLVPGLLALAALGVAGGLIGALTEIFSVGSWLRGWEAAARGVGHRLGQRPRAITRQIASGDVVATINADADAIGALCYFIVNVVGSLIATIVVAVLMLRMDIGLGLLVLLGVPIVLGGVGSLLKPLNRRMTAQREENGRLTTVTTDVVAGLRVLRGIGGEDVYADRYARQSARVREAGIRVASTQALLAAIRAGAPMILTAVVVGASATAALSGRITPGEFVTFYGYTTFLIWPLGSFADLMQFMTRAWVGAKKAARVAEVRPLVSDALVPSPVPVVPDAGPRPGTSGAAGSGVGETADAAARPGPSGSGGPGSGSDGPRSGTGTPAAPATDAAGTGPDSRRRGGGVGTDAGSQAHGEGPDPLGDLTDLATGVRVRGGIMTALVCARPGESAALAERLGRADDRYGVTLDGTDLRTLPIDQVRRTILVSGAHAEAFAGPLAAEVLGEEVPLAGDRGVRELMQTYAGAYRPDAARAAVPLTAAQRKRAQHALEVAAAGDVVDSLGGLDGQLTEKARNLSGGQRQRLALARAVARQSPVLVLVEPTSALDSHTEDLVAQHLREEREGRTTVVVTASPLLLSRCDEVILLAEPEPAKPDEGEREGQAGSGVVEIARGTHHQLSSLPDYAAVVERGAAA